MSNEYNQPHAAVHAQQRQRRVVVLGVVAAIIAAGIFLAGFGLGMGATVFGQPSTAGQGADGKSASDLRKQFGVFWEAMDVLYRDFYGDLPTAPDATYGAIRGVLNRLDDPHTSFMTPDEAEFFRSDLMEGSFEGIGARVDWDWEFDTLRIVEPFENQPAWQAGIKRDDLVTHIDGETIIGTDLTEAIKKIRGPKGTPVVLTVVRPGADAPFDVEIVRDRIEVPTIETRELDGGIAYIALNSFNENASDLVRQAVKDAVAADAQGIIFDLRGNPGGLLSQAVEVSSVFMQDADVLIERFADGKTDVYKTEGEAVTTATPLVVLVNEASASASEIVAGAVQDNKRGTLVGATTFGKGSVQLPQTLSDGSILRVTVARWFTPSDRSIDKAGLEPDEAVEFTEDQRTAGADPQLDRAIELLGGKPAARATVDPTLEPTVQPTE